MAQKLSLIYPSQHNEIYSSELLYSPLALAYVGAYTPPDWQITLHDEYVDTFIDPDEIQTDLVAMSALTPNILRTYYLADKLRARGIPVVCGGAHVSALPEEALQHFDAIVKGEAEPVWNKVIADFEAGNLQQVYDGGMVEPLEDIRLPRRDLIHPAYRHPSIITSKGCPFNCDYCFLSIFPKKKYRVLPVDAVIEDLERVKREHENTISIIVDENIAGYSQRDIDNRMALFEEMIRRKLKLSWGAQSTIEISKRPEMLKLMHKAGCKGLFIGLEATEDVHLGSELNKGFADRIDYKQAIRTIHKHGIVVIGSFILGLDSHTREYAQKLPRRMKKLKVDYPRLFFLTAWPGTPLYKSLEKQNRLQDGWSHVRKDIPSIVYNNFSEDEIRVAEKSIYRNIFTKRFILRLALRWIFREPALVKFFFRLLKLNITREAHLNKKKQLEREKRIQQELERHFAGTPWVSEKSLHSEMGGNYR